MSYDLSFFMLDPELESPLKITDETEAAELAEEHSERFFEEDKGYEERMNRISAAYMKSHFRAFPDDLQDFELLKEWVYDDEDFTIPEEHKIELDMFFYNRNPKNGYVSLSWGYVRELQDELWNIFKTMRSFGYCALDSNFYDAEVQGHQEKFQQSCKSMIENQDDFQIQMRLSHPPGEQTQVFGGAVGEVFSGEVDELFKQGLNELEKGDDDQAIETLSKALKAGEASNIRIMQKALILDAITEALVSKGERKQAIELLMPLTKSEKDEWQLGAIFAKITILFYELKRMEETRKYLKKVAEIDGTEILEDMMKKVPKDLMKMAEEVEEEVEKEWDEDPAEYGEEGEDD